MLPPAPHPPPAPRFPPPQDGLRITYSWIKGELEREAREQGADISQYSRSMVVTTQAPKELGTLRAADGQEGYGGKQ
jgi:GDP-D-mannose 3',5'-epimerase